MEKICPKTMQVCEHTGCGNLNLCMLEQKSPDKQLEEAKAEIANEKKYWGDQWVLMAEKSRAQDMEIERLKVLIEKMWYNNQSDGCAKSAVDNSWQQFKAENNL